MNPYLGMIVIFGFNFAPVGWALCNGALLSISQNTALFALLGTTYGGNGVNTFGLPDLQGRIPVGMGNGIGLSPYVIGQTGGTESVTLTISQIPAHNHVINGTNSLGNVSNPSNAFPANTGDLDPEYNTSNSPNSVTMNPNVISMTGGSQAHNNIQPYLAINYCIAMQGIFPSRS